MLHSAWALVVGTGIVIYAHERYHLVLWVVAFLGLTWASTLFFGRGARPAGAKAGAPTLGQEVTSYLTRIMYQETLFFLLPFYTYSTVFRSPNVLFLLLLGGLAVFSCLDLLFDRYLRTKPVFSLSFFALVAFSTLNLLLPLLFRVPPRFATPGAALLAVAGATPLALRTLPADRRPTWRLAFAAAVMLAMALAFPVLVPPVPLRLESATFSTGMVRETLTLPDTLTSPVPSGTVGSSLVVLVRVFAPSALPARVRLEWRRDGEVVRRSRPIDITAHEGGFRVWDGWHPPEGRAPPGDYRVILRTQGERVFGVARLRID